MRSFRTAADRAFTFARLRSLRRCRFACVAISDFTPRLAGDPRRYSLFVRPRFGLMRGVAHSTRLSTFDGSKDLRLLAPERGIEVVPDELDGSVETFLRWYAGRTRGRSIRHMSPFYGLRLPVVFGRLVSWV
jgi:hypothetical protein